MWGGISKIKERHGELLAHKINELDKVQHFCFCKHNLPKLTEVVDSLSGPIFINTKSIINHLLKLEKQQAPKNSWVILQTFKEEWHQVL